MALKENPSQVCSTREAAEMLGVSLRTIQLWVDGGVLDAWKTAGGHRRVSFDSIQRLKSGQGPAADRLRGEAAREVLFAYQPILDEQENLFGYELLYRSGGDEQARIDDPVAATAQVISMAFGELGILGAMGDAVCFINVDEQMLFEDLLLTLPPERVVLELQAETVPTDELVKRCRFLRERGYRLLLENYRFDHSPSRLLPEVRYAKVDVRDAGLLLSYRLPAHVELMAGRVETEEAYRTARRARARYFQGFHFANPSLARGTRMAPQQGVILEVLAMVVADAGFADIERRLKLEPSLCLNLLRLTNSAALGTGRRIENLREAILLIGRKNLQRWLQVLLFAHQDGARPGGASPLTIAAGFRGRFLEYLAILVKGSKTPQADKAFMVGILSHVEALLRVPIESVLRGLRLSEDVEAALLWRQGELGELLSLAEAMDESDFEEMQMRAHRLGLGPAHLHAGQVESLRFSNALAHT